MAAISRVGDGARREAPALAALVALTAVQLWPAAGPGRLPESLDLMLQYVPNAAYLQRALGDLRLPLWNPFLGAGMPFAADPGTGAWYLPAWLPLAVLPLYAAVRVALWLHLVWAALGTYAFCRLALGTGRLAAVFGATAFALTTWLPGLAGMPAVLTSVSWTPWVLTLGQIASRRGGRWIAALSGAAACQVVSGWPAGAYVAWLGLGVFVVVRGSSPRQVTRLAASGVCALLLAGALLAPAVEFVRETSYAETRSVDEAGRASYLTLLSWLRPASGTGALESSQLYVGIAALLAAVAGALDFRRPTTRALAVLAVLSLVVAAGTRTPAFAILYAWLPGFRIVYLPARLGIAAAFAVAALAAVGVERLAAGRAPPRTAWIAAISFVGLAPLALLQFWHSEGYDNFRRLLTNVGRFSGGPYLTHEQELQYAALGAASLAGLALATTRQWRLAAPTLAALLAVDVILAHQLARPPAFGPDGWYAPAFETAVRLRAALGAERGAGARWHGTQQVLTDFPRSADPALLPPNLSLLVGVRDAQGYNPLLVRRSVAYFASVNRRERGAGPPDDHWLWIEDFRNAFVDRLSVATVLAGDGAQWRVRGTRIVQPHRLAAGDPPLRGTTAGAPRPAGPALLHVVTYLGDATRVRDGEVVGELTLFSTGGERRVALRAGEHTAEWAYGRADVARVVQHRQAPVALETQLVDPVAGRYRVFEYGVAFDAMLDGPLLDVELAPRLPPGSPTTLNVAGVWLVDPGAFPVAIDALPSALRNPNARARVSAAGGEVELVAEVPERIETVVRSASGTTVTLADTYYPGWLARVDGLVVPVREADGLFRAVDVPAGRHALTFAYEPVSLKLGLAASALGAAAIGALLVTPSRSTISRRSRRNTSRP